MKKIIILVVISMMIFSGCSKESSKDIDKKNEIQKSVKEPDTKEPDTKEPIKEKAVENIENALNDKIVKEAERLNFKENQQVDISKYSPWTSVKQYVLLNDNISATVMLTKTTDNAGFTKYLEELRKDKSGNIDTKYSNIVAREFSLPMLYTLVAVDTKTSNGVIYQFTGKANESVNKKYKDIGRSFISDLLK